MKMFCASLLFALALQKDPTASGAWAEGLDRATVVYATITNPTMYDVYIVSAKSDMATTVELWDEDKHVTSLTVPSFGSLELKPGKMRVRMKGFKPELNLKSGDQIKLTLETDGGVVIPIAAALK